jgi:hypothetical protein
MNTPETKPDYLLLLRGNQWHKDLAPEKVEAVMQKVQSWFNTLIQQGKVKGTRPLGDEGRTVSGKNGKMVSDGPFAESKEAIAGYIMLAADSLEDATAIAKSFPPLEYGGAIEVRPVLDDCPHVHGMKELFANTAAA